MCQMDDCKGVFLNNFFYNLWLLLYADDAKIYRMIKEIQDQVSLQTDLHCMSLWAEKWQQRFHPDKLKYVTLSNKRKSTDRIEVEESIKKEMVENFFLG